MKLQLEIEVDESLLQTVARNAVAAAFKCEDRGYGSTVGPAYAKVLAEVARQVAAMDFAPFVASEISRKMEAVVREVTHEELRKAVKKAAKEIQEEAKIFTNPNEPKSL